MDGIFFSDRSGVVIGFFLGSGSVVSSHQSFSLCFFFGFGLVLVWSFFQRGETWERP